MSNVGSGIRYTALADISFRGGEALIFYPDRLQSQGQAPGGERVFALLGLTGLDWATDDTVMVVSDFGNRAFLIDLEVRSR